MEKQNQSPGKNSWPSSLKKFSTEDHQNTIAKLYLSRQKKGKKFKSHLTRYYKYLKKPETAGKREIAIRYAKAQSEAQS